MSSTTSASNNAELPAIDVHTHLAPMFSQTQIEELQISVDEEGMHTFADHKIGPSPLYQPELLLKYLDENRLDAAFVSAPPPYFRQSLVGEVKKKWIEAINSGIEQACALDERLTALIYVPVEDAQMAVKVIRDYLSNDIIAGWSLAAGGSSKPLDSPDLVEVWNLLAADGRPVVMHPAKSPDHRLQRHYLHNLLGNPIETAVAVSELIFGGILDKNTNIKLVLVHCGGVVPQVASRWQRGIDTARPDVNTSLKPISETLQRIYTDCLTHDPINLELARHVFGDNRLLLGSDWPFPMGLDDPREPIKNLTPQLQEQIARVNPHNLTQL